MRKMLKKFQQKGTNMILPRKIYAIQHNVTKRMYIGSSKDAGQRYESHMHQLRAGKHTIEDLQKDFDEYGEDFSLYILDEIKEHHERIKEYEWMRIYNTTERGVGYNYKDHGKNMLGFKNVPPYKEGKPYLTNDEAKRKLAKLVDGFTENQSIYAYNLLSNLFGVKGEQ